LPAGAAASPTSSRKAGRGRLCPQPKLWLREGFGGSAFVSLSNYSAVIPLFGCTPEPNSGSVSAASSPLQTPCFQ
jgi:hypothetical protein